MPEFTEYAPGTFSWVDNGTTDPAAAKAFYTALFGWDTEDSPAPDGSTYTTYSKAGKNVAGVRALGSMEQQMGVPPHWLSYITVENIDATVTKVTASGGTVLSPTMDVPDAGRFAVFADPAGAVFAGWEPHGMPGAGLANEHGTLIWNELMTNDVAGAHAFYAAVFGWSATTQEMPSGEYTVFQDGEETRAGAMALTEDMGPMPPSWSAYFAVDDADAIVALAKDLGGNALIPIMDIPQVGRISAIADPTGAVFSILQPDFPG